MAKRRYRLTEDDIAIFEAGQENANAFSDHFLRTERGGTEHPTTSPRYDEVYAEWDRNNFTEDIFYIEDEEWGVVWQGHEPIFKHFHGFRFIPWQLFVHHAAQTQRVVLGGFSSGKSVGLVASALVLAATIEGFRAMVVAPSWFQARLDFIIAKGLYEGTPYEKFVTRHISAPFPIIEIENNHVGQSSIEFRSVADDGDSLLSWRGDWAMVDQTELVPDLKNLRKNLGSRLIGRSRGGREVMGIINWVANAGPSPAMWDLYSEGIEDPDNNLSLTVTTYDNPFNTPRQITDLERSVGGGQEDIDQWLLAKRPLTHGEYFNDRTINACRARELEQVMARGLKEDLQGYEYREDRTGIYKWFLPHEPERLYLVAGDPGEANRPDRNSPVIMVWDITNWPDKAILRGFHWMDGNASISPFINEFTRLTEVYHAHGQCAFDSTGTQKVLDELAFDFNKLLVDGMSFSQHKNMMLRTLQMFLEHGKLRYPYIGGVWHQLANYKLPDTKLQQDIVACMMMSAFWLRDRLGERKRDEEYRGTCEEDIVVANRQTGRVAARFPRAATRER